MDAYKVKLKVTSNKELQGLLNYLWQNNFPLDPCSRHPKVREVDKDLAEVIFLVSSRGLQRLEKDGFTVEIVKDFSDEVDPREYVSKTNRFKAELEELRRKGK